ncbi:hypothetical protein SAZ11_57135 [Streptomyces sp. FXJ1.4098]|nr:hypothetical protein [Streptomyces sp. FXJ1.4098]
MTHISQEPSTTPASAPPPRVVSRALPRWAAPAALGAILLLAAVLYGWALGSLGWGNSYYAAAVKSMGRDWTNFLFGAFDPAGVVTVDKPPAALWPQVISTKIFGLHGWAMILPSCWKVSRRCSSCTGRYAAGRAKAPGCSPRWS